MRHTSILITTALAVLVSVSGMATAEEVTSVLPISCGNGLIGGMNCIVTKKDLKEAHEAYARGVKLHEHRRLEDALEQFRKASELVPQDMQFLTAHEMVKAKLVFDHVERGNSLLLQDAREPAAAEFRAALNLDPDNQFVQERLEEATRQQVTVPPDPLLARVSESDEIHLQPSDDRATFHFTGDARSLFAQIAAAYKVTVQFDDSVPNRRVTFNVDDLDFFTALRLAGQVSKTMWAALDSHQFLLLADNAENHKQYDRMSLRTIRVPPHSTPQETTELINVIRNTLELRFVSPGQTADVLEVRGPQRAVDACAELVRQLDNEKPQVMLDVRVYQISHQLTRNVGVHIPNTFNLYNIPAVALAGLGGQNIQQLINQLIASGGINQAGSSSLAGLLAQLTGQQNSIFSQPLATFGGGLTLMGLSLDHLAAQLSVNESWVRTLDELSMRAGQGTDATFHLGERFPIQNASYAPIYNSPQISTVLGNQSYVPPFPSVSYEDLGLQIKAKPTVQGDGSISLQLELQVRSLTGQSNNGVPVISNREYKGSVRLNDGEPTFLAGEISQTDTKSMSGIPGLGLVPLFNMAMVTNTKEEDQDELMIAITPHVLSNFERSAPAIWISER
jgi:tetratricopeptide (TPR) repeat protein